MKKLISLACITLLCVGSVISVSAAQPDGAHVYVSSNKELTATYEFVSSNENEIYTGFTDEVEYQGKKYQLQKKSVKHTIVDQTTVDVKGDVEEIVTYDNLPSKSVDAPMIIRIERNGFKYHLYYDSVEYEEYTVDEGTETVTGTTDYGFSTSAPSAPNTKQLSFTKDGITQSVTGYFDGFTTGDSYSWQSGYTLPARFIGDTDVAYYSLGSTKIPNTGGEVPPVSGYESVILNNLGLKNVRIDNAVWNGNPVSENGETVRYATLNCSRYGRTYTANYTAVFPVSVTKYKAYVKYFTHNVIISKDQPEYTIQATATYTQKGLEPLAVVIAVSVGLIILICTIIAVLYIIRKKKPANEQNSYTV